MNPLMKQQGFTAEQYRNEQKQGQALPVCWNRQPLLLFDGHGKPDAAEDEDQVGTPGSHKGR